jgi:hypothetical protein
VPALRPVDDTFFDSAPVTYSHTWSIDRAPADVWAELVADAPLSWCRGLSVRWTSPRPFAVGTTRQAGVLGALKVQEHFYNWEEGRRYTFHGTSMNVPLFAALAEDYVVEPDGPGASTFTWRIAIEPSAIGKPGSPITGLLFKNWFGDTTRHYSS